MTDAAAGGPRVLVTRPARAAAATAAALEARGYRAVTVPLLEIATVARSADVQLEGIQALLATSANALHSLVELVPEAPRIVGERPLLAVGEATAGTARALGFRNVLSAAGGGGDAVALRELARARLDPAKGPLWYAHGASRRRDLAAELSACGFEVRAAILYESRVPGTLPPALGAALARGALDAAAFFSPRTANSFARLLNAADMAGSCRPLAAFCLSEAVAEAVRGLPWADLRVAPAPGLGELLATLDRWRHGRAAAAGRGSRRERTDQGGP